MSSDLTLITPIHNMAAELDPIWDSVTTSGLLGLIDRWIWVNDGSTDQTLEALEQRVESTYLKNPDLGEKIEIVSLPQNQGRFRARLKGAEHATTAKILFLDTRVSIQAPFVTALQELLPHHASLMGVVDIDTRSSVFSLYWDRSHRFIFARHFRETRQPTLLTEQNYDSLLKGTGVWVCSRSLFLSVCTHFSDTPLLSDDTFLMKEMVKTDPILIHPELRILWRPREDAGPFLKRLWERGPSFVEYHVFERQGLFFWITLTGVVATLGWIGLCIFYPTAGIGLLAAVVLAIVASAALFAQSFTEWLRLAPLHLAVVLTFGVGILRGLGVNLYKILIEKKHPKLRASPTKEGIPH